MCELKKIINVSDSLNGTKSTITSSLEEVIREFNKKSGNIIELPWESDVSGTYLDRIQLIVTKITSSRLYFINPIKLEDHPREVRFGEGKGFPRVIEEDKTESISLDFLRDLEKKGKLKGIIT